MRRPPTQRAFTLAELIGVMVLMSVLSAAAIPALRGLQDRREQALAREVQRRLSLARSWAAATGAPAGLTVDPVAGSLLLVRIERPGDPPTAAPGPGGAAGAPLLVASQFPGAAVVSVLHGDGSTGAGTIWFGPDGRPQTRDASGAYLSDFASDALITVSGPVEITVRRTTGLIER